MENKEKNFVSAVIYVHNAESRIGAFLDMVIKGLEENFEHSEIICVNDSSEDRSLERIVQVSLSARSASVSVVNMSGYHGMEAAMNAGVDLAIGDFVFEFDSAVIDFDKSEIMRLYRRALEGYDIVSASPNQSERASSRIFYQVFAQFSNPSCQMATERFRVLSRRAINRIGSMNQAVPYRKAIYASCGLKTDRLKYDLAGPGGIPCGDKKESGYRFGLAMDSLILFTEVGYKLSMAMTALMMVMSMLMVAYSVVVYMTSHPVEGWTTTILFLSVTFFGLFGVLTVIIKYLQLLVELVFKRKHYSFESIEKLTK